MESSSQYLTLPQLVTETKSMTRADFLKTHRNPLIVAMGVLNTEEIRARCGSTTELSVAKPATHNPKVPHPLAGRVYFIPSSSRPSGSLLFGREEPADIVIPDETISTRHCAVTWDSQEVSIADVGSTNGTLVNLRPLRSNRPTELLNEDIITVGRHSFQYYLPVHFFRVLEGLGAPPNSPDRV